MWSYEKWMKLFVSVTKPQQINFILCAAVWRHFSVNFPRTTFQFKFAYELQSIRFLHWTRKNLHASHSHWVSSQEIIIDMKMGLKFAQSILTYSYTTSLNGKQLKGCSTTQRINERSKIWVFSFYLFFYFIFSLLLL